MRWGDGVWCYSCCPTEWCPKAPWSGIKPRDSSAKKDQPWRIVCCSDASCQVWPSFVTWPEEKRRRKTWADNLVPHYSTPGLQTLYYWPIEMSQLADNLIELTYLKITQKSYLATLRLKLVKFILKSTWKYSANIVCVDLFSNTVRKTDKAFIAI